MTDVKIEDSKQLTALNIWFYSFGAMTVILIAFFQTITVWSVTTFSLMLWIKQVGLQYRMGLNFDQTQFELERVRAENQELSKRLDAIDPYKDD